jgi:hypothetical protein
MQQVVCADCEEEASAAMVQASAQDFATDPSVPV